MPSMTVLLIVVQARSTTKLDDAYAIDLQLQLVQGFSSLLLGGMKCKIKYII